MGDDTPSELRKALQSLDDKAPLTARTALREMTRRGFSYERIAQDCEISASTLRRHVLLNLPIKCKTARQLELWSQGIISLALTLEEGDIE